MPLMFVFEQSHIGSGEITDGMFCLFPLLFLMAEFWTGVLKVCSEPCAHMVVGGVRVSVWERTPGQGQVEANRSGERSLFPGLRSPAHSLRPGSGLGASTNSSGISPESGTGAVVQGT